MLVRSCGLTAALVGMTLLEAGNLSWACDGLHFPGSRRPDGLSPGWWNPEYQVPLSP